jgi:hypothetical protein
MTSAAQPGPMDNITGHANHPADPAVEEEADAQPKYAGDMPDDPAEAVTYRPGQDGPGGSMDDRDDR